MTWPTSLSNIASQLYLRAVPISPRAELRHLIAVTCQMLADITGRTVETVDGAQEVGARGAALAVTAGVEGVDVLELSRRLVKANRAYTPNPENRAAYVWC